MMNPVPWLQMTNMISYQGLVRTFPKVAVTFDSSAKTTGADPILNNTSTGEATGVGVRLMNKDQSNIVLGTATPDIDLAPTSSEQTLNFFAWMEQIDQATPVTPGAVTANATYVLDYK